MSATEYLPGAGCFGLNFKNLPEGAGMVNAQTLAEREFETCDATRDDEPIFLHKFASQRKRQHGCGVEFG